MKKIAILLAISVFTASSAFALTIDSAGTSIGGGIYKPSNGVSVVAFTNGTGTNNDGTVYAAGSANIKGKKEYATNNSDPKIYSQDAAAAGTPTVSASDWTPSGTWKAQ